MNQRGFFKTYISFILIWMLEGVIVGFGAILPGVSGGTLCVVFGMYRPIIELISDLRSGIKTHGIMLSVFLSGAILGFVGLSGVASWLMEKDSSIVTCAFAGLIFGTVPELWKDAGSQGRNRESILSLAFGFAVMLVILSVLKSQISLNIEEGPMGYLFCGVMWGLSFIIPGLSSSSLLLLFGLYQPMLKGIYTLDMEVILPLGIGLAGCVFLFAKVVGKAYKKHYSNISHGVLGIVLATTIMILPFHGASQSPWYYAVAFIGGAAASYLFTVVCNRAKNKK